MNRIFWLEQTESDMPAGDDWLSPGEATRLAGMRFLKRRNDFRLGRWTGKRALSLYLKTPPSRIEIRAHPWGAPEAFVDGEPAAVNFSISHRDGVAACVVAPGQVDVGCDLELIETRDTCFLMDYFSSEEQGRVAAAAEPDRAALATLMWSGKEAVLKLLRVGLRIDTRTITVEPRQRFSEQPDCWRPLLCTMYLPESAPRVLHGQWRQKGGFVRTVVASEASRLSGPLLHSLAASLSSPTNAQPESRMPEARKEGVNDHSMASD